MMFLAVSFFWFQEQSLLCRKREYVDQLGKWAAFLAQQGMVNGLTESDQNTKSWSDLI